MALPVELNTKTVVFQAYKADGSPETGYVEYELASPIQRTDGSHVVTPSKIRATLDGTGFGSATLALSTDDDYTPATIYNVQVVLSGWRATRTITLDEVTPDTVELLDLLPAEAPTAGTSYLTRAVADTLYAPYGSTGGGGAPEDHTHVLEDVTGLDDALDGKEAVGTAQGLVDALPRIIGASELYFTAEDPETLGHTVAADAVWFPRA